MYSRQAKSRRLLYEATFGEKRKTWKTTWRQSSEEETQTQEEDGLPPSSEHDKAEGASIGTAGWEDPSSQVQDGATLDRSVHKSELTFTPRMSLRNLPLGQLNLRLRAPRFHPSRGRRVAPLDLPEPLGFEGDSAPDSGLPVDSPPLPKAVSTQSSEGSHVTEFLSVNMSMSARSSTIPRCAGSDPSDTEVEWVPASDIAFPIGDMDDDASSVGEGLRSDEADVGADVDDTSAVVAAPEAGPADSHDWYLEGGSGERGTEIMRHETSSGSTQPRVQWMSAANLHPTSIQVTGILLQYAQVLGGAAPSSNTGAGSVSAPPEDQAILWIPPLSTIDESGDEGGEEGEETSEQLPRGRVAAMTGASESADVRRREDEAEGAVAQESEDDCAQVIACAPEKTQKGHLVEGCSNTLKGHMHILVDPVSSPSSDSVDQAQEEAEAAGERGESPKLDRGAGGGQLVDPTQAGEAMGDDTLEQCSHTPEQGSHTPEQGRWCPDEEPPQFLGEQEDTGTTALPLSIAPCASTDDFRISCISCTGIQLRSKREQKGRVHTGKDAKGAENVEGGPKWSRSTPALVRVLTKDLSAADKAEVEALVGALQPVLDLDAWGPRCAGTYFDVQRRQPRRVNSRQQPSCLRSMQTPSMSFQYQPSCLAVHNYQPSCIALPHQPSCFGPVPALTCGKVSSADEGSPVAVDSASRPKCEQGLHGTCECHVAATKPTPGRFMPVLSVDSMDGPPQSLLLLPCSGVGREKGRGKENRKEGVVGTKNRRTALKKGFIIRRLQFFQPKETKGTLQTQPSDSGPGLVPRVSSRVAEDCHVLHDVGWGLPLILPGGMRFVLPIEDKEQCARPQAKRSKSARLVPFVEASHNKCSRSMGEPTALRHGSSLQRRGSSSRKGFSPRIESLQERSRCPSGRGHHPVFRQRSSSSSAGRGRTRLRGYHVPRRVQLQWVRRRHAEERRGLLGSQRRGGPGQGPMKHHAEVVQASVVKQELQENLSQMQQCLTLLRGQMQQARPKERSTCGRAKGNTGEMDFQGAGDVTHVAEGSLSGAALDLRGGGILEVEGGSDFFDARGLQPESSTEGQ